MTLPAGVTKFPDYGHRVPVTQRGWWTSFKSIDPLRLYDDRGKHYTSCMLAGAAMILERIGYQTPLLRGQHDYDGTSPHVMNMVLALHLASGKYPNGTTIADTQTAIAALFGPAVPILYGTQTRADLRSTLANKGIVRFSARPLTDMPRSWDLPAGYRGGGHAFVANRPTRWNSTLGRRELYIVDPMLRPAWEPPYVGQWVSMDKFLSYADKDTDGEHIVTWGFKSAALA